MGRGYGKAQIGTLVKRMRQGDVRALSRLISLLEQEGEEVSFLMETIAPYLGQAYSIGITGPPGAGKSTLVDKLTTHIRRLERTVGILAIDPTSPFSGGALLGDRIRMQQHYLDPGVFIRSMATKGDVGGLPRVAKDALKLLDAAGKDYVLIETVGVGQTELDIMETTDTTVVVFVPEGGDAIQTMKAGLMEIADIFVVNKADREGADRMVTEIQALVDMHHPHSWWRPPVLATQADRDIGVVELFTAIEDHRKALCKAGEFEARRQARRKKELIELVERHLRTLLLHHLQREGALGELVTRVERGEISPHRAADQILHDTQLIQHWFQEKV
ncbi:MAG: methylmalonyl Co-A mutase-associated GTPase MeaB [Nitrospinota bacterium]|nr:MAG: methylmalonyl Co-A mutase-associated GTPase MeaB [Nitrospinota bacterium]